jgi:circadian clock protein KaiC
MDFMQFMVDCAVVLRHVVVEGVSQRNIRVVKYRGFAFEENEAPFVIARHGIEVGYTSGENPAAALVTQERVSTGISRLDTMLNGGYYRGASVLISGAPGTAKTTLCGAFAEAACQRGERTLFVSFDSAGDEVVRNLGSVNIQLEQYIADGTLRMTSTRAVRGSSELHLMRIRDEALQHDARCIVVDPISALAKAGNTNISHNVVERLVDWAKMQGITLLCTSLLDHATPTLENTPLEVSTIADTWIHLSYVVQGGERNRGLTIIKSRGTGHSNQVRELILQESGITLTDVFTAAGEVLMGTLRYEKERGERLKQQMNDAHTQRHREDLASETVELEQRIQSIQRELDRKRVQQATLNDATAEQEDEQARAGMELLDRRSADLQTGSGTDHD